MRVLALLLLVALPAAAAEQVVPVLTYHRFDRVQATASTAVTNAVFAEQMDWLAAHQIKVVPLREALAVAQGAVLAAPAVAITADDGWRSVYTDMFPLIRARNLPVTLFINPAQIGQGAAYLTWAQLAEMVKSGLVDVQAHTLTHPNFLTEQARMTPAAYRAFLKAEIAGSRAPITEKLGLPADLLAWPFGLHNATLEQEAAKAGYIAAFAVGSAAVVPGSPLFALPRYQVYETDRGDRFGWIATGHPRTSLKKVTP
jgi:peptidoglycan/xylan/chitin deacetylase (PgdA/CDA1 family)